jgi:hypothetical protein
MATNKVRISAYVSEEMARYLRQRSIEAAGAPLGSLIRRALHLMRFADAKKESTK